jgi:predicted ribosome quality control (RQC) complex YloA/Tae2 family protein
VQQVVQVDEWSIGFEIYARQRRHYLLASADPQQSRVHLTGAKLRRGVETPSPLLLLLRKHVRGGRVLAVRNPPFERIVEIEIKSAHPAPSEWRSPPWEQVGGAAPSPGWVSSSGRAREGRHSDGAGGGSFVTLIVEGMGRHANVMLVDGDGTVLEAIKRVGPRMSRVRPILPGRPYARPPVQAKLDPTDVGEADLAAMLAAAKPSQPAWRVLVGGIRGVSPLLAREVVYRATGDALTVVRDLGGPPAEVTDLLETFQTLLIHLWEHDWQPTIALEESTVAAYAPYMLTAYPEREDVASISLAIDRYIQAAGGAGGTSTPGVSYAAAKANVQALLDAARRRVEGRHQALQRQSVSREELDRLRTCGEMTLAYAHAVQPGDSRLEAQVDLEGPPLVIDLDPNLTAVENAQSYFARYEKAKAAAAEIPALLRRAGLELAYLDQLALDLALATNRPDIDDVRTALVEAGYAPRPKGPKPQRGQPLRVVAEEGMIILVGRSARQNHEITFRRAGPDDLWLHAVDVPGSHVIVLSGGRAVPEGVLRRAAKLAAHHSAARGEAGVLVAYTRRRYVRPIRGGRPGMVTYRREETIRVG